MQAFNKIGFHGGGRRPATGLIDWMKTLNSAEIPFFFAAPDFTSGLLEAQAIARDSDTDHTLVFRSPSGELEPNLEQDPAEAALEHWRAQKAAFPDELDPKLTWVEPVQFSAVTEATSNWVGKFAVAMSELTLDEGYKLAAFGFGHGQPPISTWGKSGMVRYLQLCAQHPDRLAISTQEFSLKTDDIWFMRSEKVGRFNFAYLLCDVLNIPYPTTLITAFGWTEDRAPKSVDSAVADIKSVADLYAQYPSIRGAALWSLGTRNYLARQIRKLIEPVTELTLATRFAVNQSKGFSPAPMTASVASILPSQMANARFVSDLTIPDDIELPLGEPFEKQWLVENNGDVAWGDGFKLVHVGGERMTGLSEIDLPATKVGEKQVIAIEFTVPNKTGTHYSDWRFRDANGKLFGDILFTRIAAVQPTPSGTPDSRFLADVTIPDDSLLDGGETFTKTWRVKNVGSRPWSSAMSLRFTGGTAMTAEVSQPLPDVAPGGEADISLKLVAPAVPGTYFGDWRMFDESGDPFGDTVFVRIVVPAAAGSTLVEPISQRDPLWADKRLGHAGSPKTIGEWGCLLTCFAMTANALGENTNPSQLNDAMLSRGGFLNLYLT